MLRKAHARPPLSDDNANRRTTSSWTVLNTVFALSPIGRLVLLATALGAALVLLWRNSDSAATAIRTAWDAVVTRFATVLTDLQKRFGELWKGVGEGAATFMRDLGQGFTQWLAYIVWRDYDIVRLQKKLIDESADRETIEKASADALNKVTAIRESGLRPTPKPETSAWPE